MLFTNDLSLFAWCRFKYALLVLSLLSLSVEVQANDTPSVLVKMGTVQEKMLSKTITAYGVIEPDADKIQSLSLSHAGLINKVLVKLGQRVQKGDALFNMNTAPAARMQYLQAESALTYTQKSVQRVRTLFKEQLATKSQLSQAEKSLRDAKVKVNTLKKQGLNQSEEVFRAPIDGIVTKINIQQGQRVSADAMAMLLATDDHLMVQLGVEPEDLSSIHPGNMVTLHPVFMENMNIQSTVSNVHAMVDPTTKLIGVLVFIPNHHTKNLVLGSKMVGQIQVKSIKGLVVPESAILKDKDGAFVYSVTHNIAHKIYIIEGIQEPGLVEIHSVKPNKLKAGDKVVILGNYELKEGMTVRINSQNGVAR